MRVVGLHDAGQLRPGHAAERMEDPVPPGVRGRQRHVHPFHDPGQRQAGEHELDIPHPRAVVLAGTVPDGSGPGGKGPAAAAAPEPPLSPRGSVAPDAAMPAVRAFLGVRQFVATGFRRLREERLPELVPVGAGDGGEQLFHREREEHIANGKSGRKALTGVFLKEMSMFYSALPDSTCVTEKKFTTIQMNVWESREFSVPVIPCSPFGHATWPYPVSLGPCPTYARMPLLDMYLSKFGHPANIGK